MSFAREFERWHGDPPPASPLYRDSAQPIPEPRSVPVQPSDTQLLNAIGASNTEIVYLLRAILAALGSSSDSRSSVELKVSSARGAPDPTVKIYQGSSVDGLVDTALAEFGRLKREADDRSLDGWRGTVAALTECGASGWLAPLNELHGESCELPRGHAGAHGFAT